jgi:hypothetical protein
MTAIGKLAAISLDADNPAELGDFYVRLLDAEVTFTSDTFVALQCPGILLTIQRVDDYRAPDWPTGAVPKQMHLEIAVSAKTTDALDDVEAQAVALGAVKAADQPSPDRWRVLLDPAGHPFCITGLIPGF